jgi:DNA-binding transcriptional ArsR family regulator
MTEEQATLIFHALAHEHRRRVLDLVKARPGIAVGQLAEEFDVSRIAVMNHLAVLEKAGLIISQADGRTRRLYLNAAPIQLIHERWTTDYSAHWAGRLTAIKFAAEAAAKLARGPGASVSHIKPKPRGRKQHGGD